MDRPAVVAPLHVAKPLRLHPFRGLGLARGRVGSPATGRAFARPYRAVAQRLVEWQELGQVQHDQEPAVYLHEYTVGGITVRGLVGALDLTQVAEGGEAVPAVLPHEGVHPPQVRELAERMEEMDVNPAPILLVHRGPASVRSIITELIDSAPDWRFTDRARQRHRLWRIADPEILGAIDTGLAQAQALIADGHHRYAAYLALRDAHPGTPWGRGLAMLVDQDDTPLFLGAIHRFLEGTTLDDLEQALEKAPWLRGERRDSAAAMASLGPDTLVLTDGKAWLCVEGITATRHTAVEVFHQDVVAHLPNAPAITYHHAVQGTLDAVARRRGTAVLLPSADLDCVMATSRERLLPEKATSFQPKPSLGVLMRTLRDERDDR